MAREYLTCPFCGFEFARADTLCAHGCPLGATCRLARCPNCQYEFPETPRVVDWLGRLLGRAPAPPPSEAPTGIESVQDLRRGERAKVVCLAGGGVSRRNNLTVFGVVPGAEITLLQQEPACVLQVGETELALEPAIAREILVERLAPDPAGG